MLRGRVVGIYGANRIAPFKAITAASATLALTPPRRGSKKDPEVLMPTLEQFAEVRSPEDFANLVGRKRRRKRG
jgi:hypothetical protein